MDRKEFLHSGCKLCGCAALAMLPPAAAGAEEDEAARQQRRQFNFAVERVEWLMEEMDTTLDEPTRKRLWGAVGRRCARASSGQMIEKHKGDLDGLMKDLKSRWGVTAEYDREAGVIRHRSPPRSVCGCPLVKDRPNASVSLCHCTEGFHTEMYGAVSGREVDVQMEKSALAGDDHCEFTIRFA